MYSIRQESLFSLEQLLEMCPEEKYGWLFDMIDITPILRVLGKKTTLGAPERLNYRAMVYSLFTRVVERMPFVKDLVNRLRTSEEFRYHCRFTGSDLIPSEAAYSRLFAELKGLPVFQELHDKLIAHAYQEGFITGEKVAVDATHVEARDASSPARSRKPKVGAAPLQTEIAFEFSTDSIVQPETEPVKPKKRGRKSKEEREQWLQEQADIESAKNAFEKNLQGMLSHSLDEIETHTPQHPSWGTKKNTDNKKIFWYGYKGHLAVDCDSQYILVALFSSAHVNDGKMSIPLIKALSERHPYLNIGHILADAGYDYEAVYEQIRRIGAKSLVDYIQ